MNNRQEYLKKYRLEHKEKYREYQRKYKKNHLSTYEKLQQENQELKNNVNALQKELNEENFQCSKYAIENQELKKQLEEYKRLGFKHLNDKCNNLETQQKEFIELLENESRKIYRDCGLRQNIFKQVLQKYKEITGDDK